MQDQKEKNDMFKGIEQSKKAGTELTDDQRDFLFKQGTSKTNDDGTLTDEGPGPCRSSFERGTDINIDVDQEFGEELWSQEVQDDIDMEEAKRRLQEIRDNPEGDAFDEIQTLILINKTHNNYLTKSKIMRRNNEERTKGRRQQAAAVDPASLMDFVAPTEIVDLPSKGVGYPSGHPLDGVQSVEIRFMTAKDEDILTNRSLLKKGVALDKLIDNILVDKQVKSKDILVGDRNAIIIAARSSAYGHLYKTKVQCPSCGASKKMQFDLSTPETLEPTIEDVDVLDNGNYLYVTEHSKIEVEMRLLTGHDEAILFKFMNNKKQ